MSKTDKVQIHPGMLNQHAGHINTIVSKNADLLCSNSAKRIPATIPVHGGMFHVKDGVTYQSVTATDVARAKEASGAAPSDPTYNPKRLTPPMIKPGVRSRAGEVGPVPPGTAAHGAVASHADRDDAHRELGRRVLAEATRTR
jgi:hypothetical protein